MSTLHQLTVPVTPPFDFTATAYSHGWVVLEPNSWDADRRVFRRIEKLPSGRVVELEICEGQSEGHIPNQIVVNVPEAALEDRDASEIHRLVRRMFRLDEDLSEFYAICQERGGRWQKLTIGLGRILRSPTVFEDVVKTICTTNVQWGGTKGMVRRLVQNFGEEYPQGTGKKTFPTPQVIVACPFDEFHGLARLGYRSSYVHKLALAITNDEINLEDLLKSDLPTPELRKKVLTIQGVGPYAAATILMLLGRYDELGIDTVFRTYVGGKYFPGANPSDSELKSIYSDWGKWKYLAYWFDIWEGETENL